MDSQLYISSAILGVFLAIVCIYGWRRIVPVFFFGLILVKVAPGQGYDQDNDVPAINEVRDAIQYQMSVLQYELQQLDSGGTQTTQLQDISSKLDTVNSNLTTPAGLDVAAYVESMNSRIGTTNDNLSTLLGRVEWLQNYGYNTMENTADISNYSEDSLSELQDISNYSSAIQHYTWSNGQKLDDISNNLELDGVSATHYLAWLNQNLYDNEQLLRGNFTGPLTDISNYSEDSLSELQDITNALYDNSTSRIARIQGNTTTLKNYGQWDTDNDVPAIQSLESLLSGYGQWDTDNDVDAINAVGMDIDLLRNSNTNENTQIIAALTSISNAMNEISDPATSSPPADIVLTSPNTNIPTFETVAPDPLQVPILADLAQVDQDDSKLKPFTQIEQNIDDSIQHFDDTTQWDIPLFGQGKIVNLQHANMLGNIQETINGDMRQHFVTLASIIKPILTAFLIWIVIRWTTKTTISTVSG